ncbi:hypothetical protein ACFQ1E_16975 [Sphingomonas canadensis]|uniref:Uncharacterized protein n=1 Tax=Sphingomonas canadensis TaxID=1219257 RepID=A0ABW3HFF0_9SPHN|nr:hypothetical protein [Sphingomonas canadensis]MCW3837740.1 hypothetical protein [Sphingomonas canadensis]
MPNKLFETATQLSKTFMPAERTQSAAAVQAARSLIIALEARRHPEFANSACDAALNALVRGISHSVEADTALREAHRKFAKIVGHTSLPELGWGCDMEECPGAPEPNGRATPLRVAA